MKQVFLILNRGWGQINKITEKTNTEKNEEFKNDNNNCQFV